MQDLRERISQIIKADRAELHDLKSKGLGRLAKAKQIRLEYIEEFIQVAENHILKSAEIYTQQSAAIAEIEEQKQKLVYWLIIHGILPEETDDYTLEELRGMAQTTAIRRTDQSLLPPLGKSAILIGGVEPAPGERNAFMIWMEHYRIQMQILWKILQKQASVL